MIDGINDKFVVRGWDSDRNRNQNLNMISFYVDPQLCGVLFSVYWKNEKGYLFTGGTTPQLDLLSGTAFAEPIDVDWITFAGSVGLEFYQLSSSWAVVFDAAKVTGVLLLLGFGSLVGYRILKYLWLSRFSDQSEPPSPTLQHNMTISVNRNQLLEDVDNTDLNDVEGKYFGPDPAPANHGLVGMLCMHLNKLTKSLSGIRKNNINICLESFEDFQTPYIHRKNLNEHLGQSVSKNRKISKESEKTCNTTPPNASRNSPFLPRYRHEECDFSVHTRREGSFDSTCSEFSLDFTLPESCENTNIVNLDKLQQEIDKLKSNCQMMDEELEIIKCNRNLPGLSSLMETNVSETNFASNDCGSQIHSEASEALKQNARACFAGLYSLTTIKNSSSDLSDVSEPGNRMVESIDSLDWDSPQSVVTSVGNAWNKVPSTLLPEPQIQIKVNNSKEAVTSCENKQDDYGDQDISSLPKTSAGELKFLPNDVEMSQDLEWDEDDLVSNNDGDENSNNVDLANVLSCSQSITNCNSEINNLMFQYTTCKDNQYKLLAQNTTNDNSLEPDSPQPQDWNIDHVMNASKYSKESGYLEWDEETEFPLEEPLCALSVQSSPESDVQPLSDSLDAICMPNVEYVGPRTNIYKHALQVCQGCNQQGETLLKGFAEIPSLTGFQNLRQIHRDSYCLIRAAIFQGLLHHCPIPCGRTAFQSLSEAFNNYNFTWLQNWNFSTCLPYQGKEVLHGMRMCLHTLDNVVSILSSREDSEDTLALLLNSDRSLDIHIMEAVKLHLLLQAMKLYQLYSSGGNTPGFVKSMFAHESCRTPMEFMYNHLQNMGGSTYLNEVLISLLGYTLNVKMCVIHPALFGTDKFINYFSQCNTSSSYEMVLIEDEDCYSVLVK